jgi:integrase
MAVYRRQYKDKYSGQLKHTKVWWYEFTFAGRRVKESTKTTSKTLAKDAEKKRRRELEEGFDGLRDAREERVQMIRELADSFLQEYKVRQPKSATFAEYAISHVSRLVGDLMAVDLTEKTVAKYQTLRLKEDAAPKTINEEVSFLLRLLDVRQSGAIRAQLGKQRKLKRKVRKCVGKAYSEVEKTALVQAAQNAPRSKAIYMATMLALHAGMRDKEIRTLQWIGLDLSKRIVTVGESKTDAGTGRTIPMNEDLFAAAVEYSNGTASDSRPLRPTGTSSRLVGRGQTIRRAHKRHSKPRGAMRVKMRRSRGDSMIFGTRSLPTSPRAERATK